MARVSTQASLLELRTQHDELQILSQHTGRVPAFGPLFRVTTLKVQACAGQVLRLVAAVATAWVATTAWVVPGAASTFTDSHDSHQWLDQLVVMKSTS